MATPRKPDAPVDGVTANGPEVAPVDPRGLQMGQSAGSISTKPPRGVDEPPANASAVGPDGVAEPGAAALQGHIQKMIDKENAQGWRGARKSKAVPNKNYTLRGVGEGLPTPETTIHTPVGE